MLALCQHNGATYYAQNYAGIIGASLIASSVFKLEQYFEMVFLEIVRGSQDFSDLVILTSKLHL